MCAEGMVGGAILAKAMVATLPAAQRQPDFLPFAGSAREPKGHSMSTNDAWRDKDSMRQCRGDLYSVELEEGAVSLACLVTWLIEDFSIGTVFLMILSTPR